MIEVVRRAVIGSGGVLQVTLPEFEIGAEVMVTVRAFPEAPGELADSAPDVEDFA